MNQNTPEVSATDWEHLYFYGLTRFQLNEVGLDQNMTQALIRMVGVNASVSTGALIDPKYMLNQKGTTPWLAMYALLTVKASDMLIPVQQGRSAAFVPNHVIEPLFVDHINWPIGLLSRYCIDLEGFNVFILPFLVPKGAQYNLSFSQSMKAPDGSLEIVGVGKFDENRPQDLLSDIQETLEFIKHSRPDITGAGAHEIR